MNLQWNGMYKNTQECILNWYVLPLFEHSYAPKYFVIYWQTNAFPLAANLLYRDISLIGLNQISDE